MSYKKSSYPKRLFCKPVEPAGDGYLYERFYPEINGSIGFRSLDLDRDLPDLHQWVNMWYAEKFWQMQGSMHLYRSCYECIQRSPDGHSFVGFYNDKLICQVDIYRVAADELGKYIAHTENDCGFHLLMAPLKEPVHLLTDCVISCFLDYYFSFVMAKRIYGEPDSDNHKSIRLLKDAGFKKLKTITMSYKTAHLYCRTKKS